jgi:hypothetical protein
MSWGKYRRKVINEEDFHLERSYNCHQLLFENMLIKYASHIALSRFCFGQIPWGFKLKDDYFLTRVVLYSHPIGGLILSHSGQTK